MNKPKRPKPYRTTKRFGILNPYGDIWTPETFNTAAEAATYLTLTQKTWPGGKIDLRRHKVVPVRITVSAVG